MSISLEEALERIKVLEQENARLSAENEQLKARNFGGRRKHDEAWTKSYQDFVVKLESGESILEIVEQGEISRRTAYRYKAYYDELKKQREK